MEVKKYLDLLGLGARDKVTRLQGIISSINFDLYGTVYAVLSMSDATGNPTQSLVGIERLEIKKHPPVMKPPFFEFGTDHPILEELREELNYELD